MGNNSKLPYGLFFLALLFVFSCESQQNRLTGPPNFNLAKPEKFNMPVELKEISGIAFSSGKNDTIFAEDDEDGKVFHFKLGDNEIKSTRFARKGDFEDITVCNGYVIMLRSDGVLFTFPVSETGLKEALHVQQFENLLPAGEYEGLASQDLSGSVYVLCKHCQNEKTSKWSGGSVLKLDKNGVLTVLGSFDMDMKQIEKMMNIRKISFHPSALAWNEKLKQWWILSSVNHLLVTTDESWNVVAAYPLDASLFPQPEGIAFDRSGNLYISNERAQTSAATILAFAYHVR